MTKTRHWMAAPFALALASTAAPGILASEGTLEINRTCANVGCFAGDTPGLPVTITGEAGTNYRLTSNLTLATVNTTGILITAPEVTIDMAGFVIKGPVVCEGSTTVCSASGTGNGIAVELQFEHFGVTVRNGTVSGAGQHGLYLGTDAQVTDVHATSNGDDGIHTGLSSVVRNSFAIRNGDNGIEVSTGSVIVDSVSRANVGYGMFAAGGTTVSNCTAADNEDAGIRAGAGTLIESSSLVVNGDDAIIFNDNTGGYRGNVMAANNGTVTAGTDLGGNLCDGGACP